MYDYGQRTLVHDGDASVGNPSNPMPKNGIGGGQRHFWEIWHA